MPIRRGQIEDGGNIPSVDEANRIAKLPVDTTTALGNKADDTAVVKLTGNQNVTGTKTFTSSPVVPAATTATQAVNKSQLDAAVAAAVTGARIYRGTFGNAGSTTGGDLPADPNTGDVFICIEGSYISAEAGYTFKYQDQASYNGTGWDVLDGRDAVASINGQLGTVNITASVEDTEYVGVSAGGKSFTFNTISSEPETYTIFENGIKLRATEVSWAGGTVTVGTSSADAASEITMMVYTAAVNTTAS